MKKLPQGRSSSSTTLVTLVWFLCTALSFTCQAASSIEADKSAQPFKKMLTLEVAVESALTNDLWLLGNQHTQHAIESMSVAAGSLPDPKMSLGIANIGADSFSFEQEAMTQFKVGLSQNLARGDSLKIKQKQLILTSSQFPFQRADRKAKVKVMAAQLWLNAYKAQESIALIENNRALFEQLADVAQASYSSALGKTRQQDIVRAQLELTRLDDRLTQLNQNQQVFKRRLSEWLSDYFIEDGLANEKHSGTAQSHDFVVANQLPDIAINSATLVLQHSSTDSGQLAELLNSHPAVKNLQQKIAASKVGIELAKQKYKPQIGLNASYGYRGDDQFGNTRADLFSLGVTFDIPLFTANRQDKQVESAIYSSDAVKTEKWELIRKMMAEFETAKAQLINLNQRQQLYQQRLLPQTAEQAEASLTAYTNDDGDFAEVVRARIGQLNAEIEALGIDVERQKTILQLNYYTSASDEFSDLDSPIKTSEKYYNQQVGDSK